jgi:hypothetical protein
MPSSRTHRANTSATTLTPIPLKASGRRFSGRFTAFITGSAKSTCRIFSARPHGAIIGARQTRTRESIQCSPQPMARSAVQRPDRKVPPKCEKPFHLDMLFEEALRRYAQAEPHAVTEREKAAKKRKPWPRRVVIARPAIEHPARYAERKRIITAAQTKLAAAAIRKARMILSLSTLSEPDANWWLGASELTLVASAIVLTVGLIGEWPDSESWKKRWLYNAAKVAVVLGVVGELIGDAGIFETSARLAVLQHAAIDHANTQVAAANERAGSAIERAAKLEKDAEELHAQNLALEQQIQPRRLKPDQLERLTTIASKYSGEQIAITSYALDVESALLGEQLVRFFRSKHIPFDDRRLSISAFGGVVLGMRVSGTDDAFAKDVRDAFRSFGFVAVGDQPAPVNTGISIGPPNAPAPVNLFIGAKPPPF